MSGHNLSMSDFYNEVQRGRELELKNLWQRSIMLMTFFVIFFTAYATLAGKVIEIASGGERDVRLFNIPLLAIAICGLIVSIFWIQMAKGSKLWYEKFEASVDYFVKKQIAFDESVKLYDYEQELKNNKLDCYTQLLPKHGHLCDKIAVNDSLFSPAAGEYSVSKINIGIGLFGFICWSSLAVFHIAFMLCACLIKSVIISILVFVIAIAMFFISGYTYSGNNKRFKKRKIRIRLKIYNEIKKQKDKACLLKLLDKYYRKVRDENAHKPKVTDLDKYENYFIDKTGNEDFYPLNKKNGKYRLKRFFTDYAELNRLDTLTWNYMRDLCKIVGEIDYDNYTEKNILPHSAGIILLIFASILILLISLLQFLRVLIYV